MNERIRELYEQARLHAKSIDADIDPKGWMDEYHRKFAELIVRECINCSNDLVKHYIDNHNESDQALLLASISDYVNEIKKHFGIEE